MNDPIEDRLRAHFAERAEHKALPTVSGGVPVLRAPRPRWQRPSWLATAAAVLVLAGVAAGLALADDEGTDDVDVVGADDSTTTTAPVGTSTTATSSATSTTGAPAAPTTAAPQGGTVAPSIVVSLAGVLGWWDGVRWVRADDEAAVPAVGGERYTVLQLGESPRTASGSAPRLGCEPSGSRHDIDLGLEFPGDRLAPHPVAVSGVSDPEPRATESLDRGSTVYRDVAVDVLAGLGVDDPEPPIVQLLRTDLEGDGVDEVIMTIERLADPVGMTAAAGDYSVLALRRVVDGQAVTELLRSFVMDVPEPETPSSIVAGRVDAVADLNGDGRMEIVTHGSDFEGLGTVVHELTSAGLREVLGAGCGA